MLQRMIRMFRKSGRTKLRRRLLGTRRYRPTLDCLEDRLAPAGFFVAGADAGGGPLVQIFDAETGDERGAFFAFDPAFTGGVRVAAGDVTGDGLAEVVVAAGAGGGPQVNVFSGRELALLASFLAFDPSFTGGVSIAVGDVNGDGVEEIIAGAGAGGGPQVRVFDMSNGQATQIAGPLGSFMAYDATFQGGVNVAAGNVDGALGDELITGPGPGGGPNVKVFDQAGAVERSFFAFDPGFTAGVFVGAGDVNADGHVDIIAGAGAGGGPQVNVFSGQGNLLLSSFFAYDAAFSGGVRVASEDFRDDGRTDIVTGAGPGGGPDARVIDSQTLGVTTNVLAFGGGFTGGVTTAAAPTVDELANWQIQKEATPISRLARFVANTDVPDKSNWAPVSPGDSHLKDNVYVIAHGFAPGFLSMVTSNSPEGNPLKWWETLDTSLKNSPGYPNTSSLFYATLGGTSATQISPTGLAQAIALADTKAVVLAYSWVDESATDSIFDVGHSEAYTSMNGFRLADALEAAIPTGFQAGGGTLHLIGHSHGSKVASVATITLEQSANADVHVKHLTLLDSPEDNSIGGSAAAEAVYAYDASNNLWFYLGALNIGSQQGKIFVDSFISYFGQQYGPIKGVTPLDPSTPSTANQQVVDVVLAPGTILSSTDPGNQHSYAINWYAGAAQKWAQNPQTGVVIKNSDNTTAVWSPLLSSTPPSPTSGTYHQSWASPADSQFTLTGNGQANAATQTSTFTPLSLINTSVTPGSSYESGVLILSENGSSAAEFTGEFSAIVSHISGVSFNFQFDPTSEGDQLLIAVDDRAGNQIRHFVMTASVAGSAQQFGTISLGSLAHRFDANIQIKLAPAKDSKGAKVTLKNMQQFTSPG